MTCSSLTGPNRATLAQGQADRLHRRGGEREQAERDHERELALLEVLMPDRANQT
jgi:hypothetical protein